MNSDNDNNIYNVNVSENQNRLLNQIKEKKKRKNELDIMIYPTFTFFLIINLGFYFYRKYYSIRLSKFSISLWPILFKYQLYRLITHHFIHYGICHLFIELYFSFYICKYLEKNMGTLYSFYLIFIMIIMTSITYFTLIFLFKFFGKFINFYYNCDFIYECGMSSLLFSLYSYIIDFQKNKNKNIRLINIAIVKMRYSSFYILIALSLFTPNTTFLGNLCGIISAKIIKNKLKNSIFPKFRGVYNFEKKFNLNNYKKFYFSIIEKNEEMKETLKELFKNINFNSFEQKDQLGIQMKDIEDNILEQS